MRWNARTTSRGLFVGTPLILFESNGHAGGKAKVLSIGDVITFKLSSGAHIDVAICGASAHEIFLENANGTTWRMSRTHWNEPKSRSGRVGSFSEWTIRARA